MSVVAAAEVVAVVAAVQALTPGSSGHQAGSCWAQVREQSFVIYKYSTCGTMWQTKWCSLQKCCQFPSCYEA